MHSLTWRENIIGTVGESSPVPRSNRLSRLRLRLRRKRALLPCVRWRKVLDRRQHPRRSGLIGSVLLGSFGKSTRTVGARVWNAAYATKRIADFEKHRLISGLRLFPHDLHIEDRSIQTILLVEEMLL
jgi:hypothetical protein